MGANLLGRSFLMKIAEWPFVNLYSAIIVSPGELYIHTIRCLKLSKILQYIPLHHAGLKASGYFHLPSWQVHGRHASAITLNTFMLKLFHRISQTLCGHFLHQYLRQVWAYKLNPVRHDNIRDNSKIPLFVEISRKNFLSIFPVSTFPACPQKSIVKLACSDIFTDFFHI